MTIAAIMSKISVFHVSGPENSGVNMVLVTFVPTASGTLTMHINAPPKYASRPSFCDFIFSAYLQKLLTLSQFFTLLFRTSTQRCRICWRGATFTVYHHDSGGQRVSRTYT